MTNAAKITAVHQILDSSLPTEAKIKAILRVLELDSPDTHPRRSAIRGAWRPQDDPDYP